MHSYDDQIISPSKLKESYLHRLYARVNRGLQDSYEQGYALLSNCDAITDVGRTYLGGFNSAELELVKEWLVDEGYTVTEIPEFTLRFKDEIADMKLFKVTWPL